MLWHEAADPAGPALVDAAGGAVWNHGELRAAVRAVASHMDRPQKSLVFCLCRNDPATVIGYLAALEAGHAVMLLDSAVRAEVLADLLARSGCLAVTGGLECSTDRLLALQRKGFDLTQATRVMAAFARAGVLVHAYLMYGYPTQTAQETVDALELVRQLFAAGFLHSAYWHRFALTVHSPAFRAADQLGIRILAARPTSFARNEIPFSEPSGEDPAPFTPGLLRAVYNFMHGAGLHADVRSWFAFPVPRPKLARGFVRAAISRR